MASFKKVDDVHGWIANHEVFEPKAIRSKVDHSGRLFDLEYEVSKEGFLVSDSRTVGGAEEKYFYLAAFACSLRFSFLDFKVEVLRAYNVASSQLHPNYWEILWAFFLRCWKNDVIPTFGMFKRFYNLKRRKGWYFFQLRGPSR